MTENFDATQFITFDIADDSESVIKQVKNIFEDLGFKVLQDEEIRKVKRQYFSRYRRKVFIELEDDTFYGEVELWPYDADASLDRIVGFVEQLKLIFDQKEISNLCLILTRFGEEGYTSDAVLKVTPDEIMKGILATSIYNFDVKADNLILEIV